MDTEESRRIYMDIIDKTYHGETLRKRMSLINRAAQFAPYASLRGYDDMVREEARLTDSRHDLSEFELELLNQQLYRLADAVSHGITPTVTVTYFREDGWKAGGSYESIRAAVKEVNAPLGRLLLYGSENTENRRVPPIELEFYDLLAIEDL